MRRRIEVYNVVVNWLEAERVRVSSNCFKVSYSKKQTGCMKREETRRKIFKMGTKIMQTHRKEKSRMQEKVEETELYS